ncbi:hypothetical protein K1T71_001105 [Dendrolimus kikuchii]|uniref:Uncharacterized protein n=1 Tax=Dendrolimus kikuchii TaxID=765133 RepID=A0ACC1DH90_9NEOP|nr:hypothetical protein K1T71_001105 [Dendrolimus kikuchii]
MSNNITKENIMQPATLQEAINIIKFLTTSHKQEVARLREAQMKQAELIKKLELNRKKELEFLSGELQKYEINLALRTETVAKQLSEKDIIIKQQAETIEELNKKLRDPNYFAVNVPEILVDSNSDSGIALEAEDSCINTHESKPGAKTVRKCSRRFGDTISFLRRVDFSPMKYKPSKEASDKNNAKKQHSLEVPIADKGFLSRQLSRDKSFSDDERNLNEEAVLSDSGIGHMVIKPNKMNNSMNNHFSDDGSEDTSEEIFDRVMTRSSVRKSVKANPKYKKINRSKSKLLEQVKVNILD